jgi:hypothetical protein
MSNFLIKVGAKSRAWVAFLGRQQVAEDKPLVQGAGCLKKGQLLHTPHGKDDRWIFASKNVTYQKPPFWVA